MPAIIVAEPRHQLGGAVAERHPRGDHRPEVLRDVHEHRVDRRVLHHDHPARDPQVGACGARRSRTHASMPQSVGAGDAVGPRRHERRRRRRRAAREALRLPVGQADRPACAGHAEQLSGGRGRARGEDRPEARRPRGRTRPSAKGSASASASTTPSGSPATAVRARPCSTIRGVRSDRGDVAPRWAAAIAAPPVPAATSRTRSPACVADGLDEAGRGGRRLGGDPAEVALAPDELLDLFERGDIDGGLHAPMLRPGGAADDREHPGIPVL